MLSICLRLLPSTRSRWAFVSLSVIRIAASLTLVAAHLSEIWDKGLASTSKKSAREQSVLVGFLVAQLEPVIEELERPRAETGCRN